MSSCGLRGRLTSWVYAGCPSAFLSSRGALVSPALGPELLHLVLRGALQCGSPTPPGAAADFGSPGHVLGAALRVPGRGAVGQRPLAHRLHQGGAAADLL